MANINSDDPYADKEKKADAGVSLVLVLHAVQRHPFALLGVILLAVSSIAGVWYFLPLPKKSAAIVFHISSQQQTLLVSASENRGDFSAYKQSQMALVKSRRTLNAALKEPEIRNLQMIRTANPDAISWLDKNLTVDTRNTTNNGEFMRVTIDGDSEEELLTLLNAVAKAYQTASYDHDNGARLQRQNELEKSHSKAKNELKQFQSGIDDIANALGSKDAVTLAILDTYRQDSLKIAVREHAILREKLEIAIMTFEARKVQERQTALMAVIGTVCASKLPQNGAISPVTILPEAIEVELKSDPVLKELELAIVKAQKILKDAENALADTNHPSILKYQAEVKAAEEKRDNYAKEARTRIEAFLKEKAVQAEQGRFAAMQSEIDNYKLLFDRSAANIQDLQKEIARVNKYKNDLDAIKSEIAQKEKITTQMWGEIEQMKIEGKITPRVTVSEEPFIVPGIEGNRRLKYALLTALGVFFLGFAGIVGWEFRRRRVTHVDEVSTRLGARLIGTIPPLNINTRDPAHNNAHAFLVEAIDTTRTMLMLGTPKGTKLRVLMVTSAVPGEGKTTLAGHLAISLSRAGFRTLLVDGDMHAPSAHSLFEIRPSPGLSELLRGEVDIAAAISSSPIPGLYVLPAGKWNMATRQMLVGNRWGLLKKELETQFDFVIVDSSPMLLVTDTILLAREADGVVLSVLLGVSQVARVAETVNRLHAVGVDLVGVIVNNVPSDVYERGYTARSKYPAMPNPVAIPEPRHAVAVNCETSRGTKVFTTGTGGKREGNPKDSADEAGPYAEEFSEEV